ncbi:site-specific integrase [Dysgonomonas sp. 520]|uniref:site-specific integrase n=1 Tax=Dysgonomonas sp. 520 TaxID=2302931 RepID=UPI0013D259D8|nr:site-specific integrase [Dysgonomonas sp. 520]NDW10051.1 site-specific integrase [Dysgonomonas sp. 520]
MNFNVYFDVRVSKTTKAGVAPLEVQLNVNQVRTKIQLSRKVKPELWNKKFQMVEGDDVETKDINAFIELTRTKLYECQTKLMARNIPVTAETIKDLYTGKIKDKSTSLVTLYQEHNDEYAEMYKTGAITYTTYQKHTTTLKHLQSFLREKYDRDDIQMNEITKTIIESFWNYIRTTLKIQNNTSVNYMKNLRKICLRALNDGVIDRNPFAAIKLHIEPVDVDFLVMDEIKTIYNKDCHCERLNQIKDIFIFSCFTGLAYIDCAELKAEEHIKTDNNGNLWIMKKREKTGIMSNIPLLPIAIEILEKYDYKLPIISNTKTNAYLKEIAAICGIKKNLHFHCARHSFATSVTLNNNIALTSVSKMMGHTNTKITQRYAKVLESTLMNEMNNVANLIKM